MGICSSELPKFQIKRLFSSEIDECGETAIINGTLCYIVGISDTLKIREYKTNTIIFSLTVPNIQCISKVFDSKIAIGLLNGKIRVFNLHNWTFEKTIDTNENCVKSIILNDNQVFALYTDKIQIWNLITQRCESILGCSKTILCLYTYKFLIVGGLPNGSIKVWNSGNLIHTLRGHTDSVTCVLITALNGDLYVISGSIDKTIKFWNLHSGDCGTTLYGHKDVVNCLTLKNNYLISGSSDGSFIVWDLLTRTLECIISRNNPIIKLDFIQDKIIVIYDNKMIEILK